MLQNTYLQPPSGLIRNSNSLHLFNEIMQGVNCNYRLKSAGVNNINNQDFVLSWGLSVSGQ